MELPRITFDEETIVYFADMWESQPEADVVEGWSPHLISHDAAQDDEAAAEVCRAVLRRLHQDARGEQPAESSSAPASEVRPKGEVPGLRDWLETQKLQKYAQPAQEWCAREGVSSIDEILNQHEKFSTDLSLKMLEARRVKKDADARREARQAGHAPAAEPRIAPSSAARAAALLREAEARGCEIFGPPKSEARYIVTGELGWGATACVKRCILCTNKSQDLAVKIIPTGRARMNADPARALTRVRREIQNMMSLDHQHVVKMYDSWETDETLYVVMELVEGGELLNAITERRGLEEPEARHVFMQLVKALEYIHSKNVIHRDLKPENILVDTRNSVEGRPAVKISDFGASKLVDDGAEGALTQVGTPQYWAPEVSDPRTAAEGYDKRVDLWSLGVVLFVMLEGIWPFQGERMEDNVRKANFSFREQSRTSKEARDLIRKLIQVRPQDRLPLDRCLTHPWVVSPR